MIGMVLLAVGFFFLHAQASTFVSKNVKKNKASAQALYSLFYYSGAGLGVFVLEPFYHLWGWQGVLGCTRIGLALCIGLVLVYRAYDQHQHKESRQLPIV
jgi:YNFM family putative membrane transporter